MMICNVFVQSKPSTLSCLLLAAIISNHYQPASNDEWRAPQGHQGLQQKPVRIQAKVFPERRMSFLFFLKIKKHENAVAE